MSTNQSLSLVQTHSIFNIKTALMKVMIIISTISIVASIVMYVNSTAFLHGGTIIDLVLSALFIFSIVFFGLHSIGYYLNFLRSIKKYEDEKDEDINCYVPSKSEVAVLIPVYNEPFDMFRMNLGAVVNTSKDLANVYVLDDSTDLEISKNVKKLCEDLEIQYIHRENRRGYKAGAINDILSSLKEEFVCVLDADQMPSPGFLRAALPYLKKYPNLAMVQIPQHYVNLDASMLSMAAQAQQSIFYSIITKGKSTLSTLFSCGTNIVYRKDALMDVGKFDETSITEDLATTINMHLKGWDAYYLDKRGSPLVYGRAPTQLAAYFNQQSRWAFGTMRCLKKIFTKVFSKNKILLRNGEYKSFSLAYKFDYFLTGSWFFCGWAYLIQMILPIAFLLFNLRPLTLDLTSFVVIVLPYTIFTASAFLLTYAKTGNSLKYAYYNLCMNIISFPITTGASIQALRNKRKSFVTARTGSSVSWVKLWPQLLMMSLLTVSIVKGILFDLDMWFYVVNIIYAAFHLSVLIPIFKLNSIPKESDLDVKLFKVFNPKE